MDRDGDLWIVGRTKDLIIRGGYNVYPREVEEVLYGHPAVLEAAVIGIPDERLGEEVAAVVVPRPGQTLDLDELREWLKRSAVRLQGAADLPGARAPAEGLDGQDPQARHRRGAVERDGVRISRR